MRILSNSIDDGKPIGKPYAFGVPDPEQHMSLGQNLSPHIAWQDLPAGTRSLALICHDPDVPGRADDVNQEGKIIPADMERVDFFHWVVVDIDPALGTLKEGDFSQTVTPKGKDASSAPHGTRVGINTFTDFLAGDADMAGTYWSYDGPCPPWNDAIKHRYVFTLYALDVERVDVMGEFTGEDVRRAIEGHVLGQDAITGTYSLNWNVPA